MTTKGEFLAWLDTFIGPRESLDSGAVATILAHMRAARKLSAHHPEDPDATFYIWLFGWLQIWSTPVSPVPTSRIREMMREAEEGRGGRDVIRIVSECH